MDGMGVEGDRGMMRCLLELSSSETARLAALAWLGAYDAARARGASERAARTEAAASCEAVMRAAVSA